MSSSNSTTPSGGKRRVRHQQGPAIIPLPLINHIADAGGQSPGSADQPLCQQALIELFECPVCYDYVLPPIYQCSGGHLLCSECRLASCSGNCHICRGPIGNIRNLAMEKVAQTLRFPCRYVLYGCNAKHMPPQKLEHEEVCVHRPYSCPCPGSGCKWTGTLEHVMQHLLAYHKSITSLSGEDIVFLATDIHLPGAVDWVMMQSCFGQHFMLVLEKHDRGGGEQDFYAMVQLVGPKKICDRFSYRLELTGNRRRLAFEASPSSIHDGVTTAILNSDCLAFNTATVKNFSENGNLAINVTISASNNHPCSKVKMDSS